MERISYSGLSVLTGSAIARAVIAYANALAQGESSASVEIPVRLEDGRESRATLLIGPASQLISIEQPTDGGELEAPEVVAEIEGRTRSLGSAPALPLDPDPQWNATAEEL
jgi:hypothetical protein